MCRFYLISVHELTAKVTVDFVQIQSVGAGNITCSFQDVLTQFFHIASLAGVVSRSLYTARQRTLRLKASHIVCLPAVQGEGNLLQSIHCFFYIYADGSVTFFCHFIGFQNQFFFHDGISFIINKIYDFFSYILA